MKTIDKQDLENALLEYRTLKELSLCFNVAKETVRRYLLKYNLKIIKIDSIRTIQNKRKRGRNLSLMKYVLISNLGGIYCYSCRLWKSIDKFYRFKSGLFRNNCNTCRYLTQIKYIYKYRLKYKKSDRMYKTRPDRGLPMTRCL